MGKTLEKLGNVFRVYDYRITTWLSIGAALQLLSLRFLPPTISTLIPILYLTYRIIILASDTQRIYTGVFTNVKRGRWTAELPISSGKGDKSDGIVMFVLGARINHPMGRLASGSPKLAMMFQEMWAEAEQNREKWGFLGKTRTLSDVLDPEGITLTWLSYWRDVESLQAFASSKAHFLGQKAYLAKEYPYVGIMHETYNTPRGNFETIYHNFPPWGLGKANFDTSKEDSGVGDLLLEATGPQRATMLKRMRGEISS